MTLKKWKFYWQIKKIAFVTLNNANFWLKMSVSNESQVCCVIALSNKSNYKSSFTDEYY